MATSIIPGILFLLAGIWLLYWVGKRRFHRRGPGGLQQFSSYGRGLVVMVIEKVAKVVGWVLIVAGILWFLYVREVGKRKEKTGEAQTEEAVSRKRISTGVHKC